MKNSPPLMGAFAVGSAVLWLTSCTTLEPKHENVVAGQIPEHFSKTSGNIPLKTAWWEAFNSETLNRLMNEAFSGNLTLQEAAARLEQAEATATISGAAGKLQLNAQASTSSKYNAYANAPNSTTPAKTLGLYASYEVDLWGRLKSSEQAALANWEATKFDLQTVAISLSAELANSYFTWLTQTEALSIYESQLQSSLNKLSAMELRYATGQATTLDLLQQRQQVASAEAKLPPVRAAISTAENQIAVLTGKIPGTDLQLTPEPLPSLPPQPAAGLPVALLENRPDLQAARLALESADWSVGAARAARLPTLSLSGNAYTTAENVDDLFDDWVSNLAASILAPLLDGGARKGEVDRTMAVSREKIAAYRQAVLEAVQETENALSDEAHQADYVQALAKQYAAAQKSEAESILRYQRGILSYFDTLAAIVLRESLQITYLQAQADLLADRIQLYRSLGGDWTFILENK
ncbi:efflux transporter outer membrane subunit [Pontiellaceae bacterium B12219]|nr:efflux transporter outer membrane subunit [Pontiellaceae bacterium B12219]